MSTLTITRGLPGSGKTTYAKRWVGESAETRSRLNRDDLREVLHGGPHGYSSELEKAVTLAQQSAAKSLLLAGRDVICDDMNLQNRQVKEWMKLAAEVGADFSVVDFTNIHPAQCIENDQVRRECGGRYVGAEYIWKKYDQFIKGRKYPLPMPELAAPQHVEPYVAPAGKPKCILVDIDGTTALMNGRGPFDWKLVGTDKPNRPVVTLLELIDDYANMVLEHGGQRNVPSIIFMSGRDEVCRAETEDWLLRHTSVEWEALYMRPSLPDGVNQPGDEIVKLALFDEHIRHNYDVQFVLDDRDKVVAMWRSIGLTCLQVAPGPF